MRIVLQRVRRASVTVEERSGASREVASIGAGLVALVGFAANETPQGFERMTRRLIRMRIFNDEASRLHRSLEDTQGELLLIPQVTLTASLEKGTRPSFHTAAPPEAAHQLFAAFVQEAQRCYPRVKSGVFQAHMIVNLENDGPVTFVLEDP